MKNRQDNQIFIFMDDSGKLNKNEVVTVFAGLVFYNSKEISEFCNKYKAIINDINCDYCAFDKSTCLNKCPEIKGSLALKPKHRRRLFNLLKQQTNFAVFINNGLIYDNIMAETASRGRYCDYAKRRIVKDIVSYSLRNKYVSSEKEINLFLKIDEEKTKSDGYYSLDQGIKEELTKGISNFNYNIIHPPILKNGLYIDLTYYNSKKKIGVQGADVLSNLLRSKYSKTIEKGYKLDAIIKSVEIQLFLP